MTRQELERMAKLEERNEELEKAKAKLTKIAIEDGWMDFKIIQVDDGCYILEDDCE